MKDRVLGLGVIALVIIGLLAWSLSQDRVPAPAVDTAGWQTYYDESYGYSFQFPPDYKFKEFELAYGDENGGMLTIPSGVFIDISVRIIEPYLDQNCAADEEIGVPCVKNMNFREFSLELGQSMCDADGPLESIQCTDTRHVRNFTTPKGLEGTSFDLVEERRTFDGKDYTNKQTRIIGPAYALDVSGAGPLHVLFFFPSLEKGQELTFEEQAILRAIVETVRLR